MVLQQQAESWSLGEFLSAVSFQIHYVCMCCCGSLRTIAFKSQLNGIKKSKCVKRVYTIKVETKPDVL